MGPAGRPQHCFSGPSGPCVAARSPPQHGAASGSEHPQATSSMSPGGKWVWGGGGGAGESRGGGGGGWRPLCLQAGPRLGPQRAPEAASFPTRQSRRQRLPGPHCPAAGRGALTGPQMCSVLRRHQQAPRPSPLAGSRLPPPCSLCQCDDSSRGRVQAASVRSLSAEPAGRAHSRPMAGRSPPQPRLAFVRCALPACPQPALGAVRFRATGEPPLPLHPAPCLGPRWLCVLAWACRRQVEREGQGQVGDVGQEPCPTRASCPQAAAVIPSRVGRRARRRLGPGRARKELGSRCNLENPAASSPHLGRWGSDGQQLQDPRPHSRVAARRQAGLCSSGTC